MHYDTIDDLSERAFDYVVIGGGSAGDIVDRGADGRVERVAIARCEKQRSYPGLE